MSFRLRGGCLFVRPTFSVLSYSVLFCFASLCLILVLLDVTAIVFTDSKC